MQGGGQGMYWQGGSIQGGGQNVHIRLFCKVDALVRDGIFENKTLNLPCELVRTFKN